ncbi:MAG: hypothetical protein GKS01_02195 [Alphaproteobacteria bacterium]|nr:hypothetical protein [Alphaproteobacteria bacterium]
MNKRHFKSAVPITALLVSLAISSAANAAAITATWQDGNIDDWNSVANNGTNWNFSSAPTTAAFPNNDVNDTFSVQIDNGGAGNSTVNLNADVTIDSLSVSSGDTLNFDNGRDMTLVNSTIVNNGAISMNSIGSTTALTFSGTGSITGTGTLTINNQIQNRILMTGATEILTNGTGHTIQGGGTFLNNNGGIINNGSIVQQGTVALTIDPNDTAGFVNNNILRAEGTGGLLLNAATYTNTGSTIQANTGSHVAFQSANVTIIGGNLTTTGTGEIRANVASTGALLDGVTITGGSNFIQANGADVRIQNGVTNEGNWELNLTGSTTLTNFIGTQTLTGSGTIKMSDNIQNRIQTSGATDILTNDTNHSIRGAGTLLSNLGGVINDGTIIQEGTAALTIDPNDSAGFVNNGTLRATGTGGISLNAATYTNNTVFEATTGSNITTTNASTTIVGGDLTTTGTGEIRTTVNSTGALLDNVRLTTGSKIAGSNGNDWRIQNGFVNDGTFEMNSTGSTTQLNFIGSQTISGNGEIVMSHNIQNQIRANGGTLSTDVLTIGAGQEIRGAGNIGANSGGIINNGTIRQQGAVAMTLDPGSPGFTNNNILKAEGAGGISLIIGTYTNNTEIEIETGSNLTFTSFAVELLGGDLTTTGTGEIRTTVNSTGATLDNVRLTSGSKIAGSNGNDWRFKNGFVNDGTIEVNSTGSTTDLNFAGTQTLSGNGSIVMSDNFQNRIKNTGSLDVLTIGSGQMINGAGQIGANTGGIINQGTITADQTNNAITIDGGTALFRNQGTIRATGAAGVDINGTSNQFVQETGGLVDVQSGSRLDVTAGSYVQSGGQTTVNGLMTTAGTSSTIQITGGRFGGSGTVVFGGSGTHTLNNTGGTLAAGNSPGILTLTDGDYVQGAAANFEFELFGAVVGVGHDLLNILGGDTDLSGSLDVVADQGFASSLTVGDQFEVIRLESGQSFLSGFFDTLTTNFTGLTFSQLFIGDSLWIEVTQADVPAPGVAEPGGMLIFVAGLGVLAVTRRRRRTIP